MRFELELKTKAIQSWPTNQELMEHQDCDVENNGNRTSLSQSEEERTIEQLNQFSKSDYDHFAKTWPSLFSYFPFYFTMIRLCFSFDFILCDSILSITVQ